MIEAIQDSKAVTRRAILTRDFKAICAMATVPVVLQMMAPKPVFAHERDDDGGEDRDWGGGWDRDRDRGDHDGHGGHHGGRCFLRGTKISTATGERRVEDLSIGDLVPTVFGGTRRIQWIGRFRRIRSDLGRPWAKSARPVRIARSALAPNVPHSDLYVTQGHALLFDDLLIPAGSLINGTTISLYAAEEYDVLEFFHIKLESHDVILAEGAPCETLLRVDETMSNFADYFREHGATEAPALYCAAIVCNGLRSELSTRVRSLMSPWLGPQKFDNVRIRLEQRAMALM
jgi:Hint domain